MPQRIRRSFGKPTLRNQPKIPKGWGFNQGKLLKEWNNNLNVNHPSLSPWRNFENLPKEEELTDLKGINSEEREPTKFPS